MVKMIITTSLKLGALLLVMTTERVIGLPLLSLLLGLIWLDHTSRDTYLYPLFLLLLSYLLATSYVFSWIVSYFIWLIASQAIGAGEKIVADKKRRFLIVVIIVSLFLLWWLQIQSGYISLIQFVASYLLVTLWMRIFNLKRLQSSNEKSFRG